MRNLLIVAMIALASCGRPNPAESPASTEAATASVSATDLSGSVILNAARDKMEGWHDVRILTAYTDGERACGTILRNSRLAIFYATRTTFLAAYEPGKNPTADACAKLATADTGNRH